jgi:hypothetical protein
VSDWFAKQGRLNGGAVADAYVDMVLRLLRQSGGPQSGHLSDTHEQLSTSRPRRAHAASGHPRGHTRRSAGGRLIAGTRREAWWRTAVTRCFL